MQTKESVERQYELLKELYGIQSSGWSMLHERFNRYVFCEANRKSLIAEYKNAVYSCLTGLGGD
jgi:hypothetical protein